MSDRSANWDVVKRCLNLFVMLQWRPHGTEELLNKLYGREVKREAAVKRLEKDLQRLKHHWGVDIEYDRSEKRYHLLQMGHLALIDLPTDALHALIFLEGTFFEGVPYDNEVNTLVTSIKRALPEARLREWQTLAAQRSITLSMEGFDRDIRHDVVDKLRRAHRERRVVTFEYHSPQQADEQARYHRVEPRERRC
jgi:predicted DNA-binding transcriptional regulator YafY